MTTLSKLLIGLVLALGFFQVSKAARFSAGSEQDQLRNYSEILNPGLANGILNWKNSSYERPFTIVSVSATDSGLAEKFSDAFYTEQKKPYVIHVKTLIETRRGRSVYSSLSAELDAAFDYLAAQNGGMIIFDDLDFSNLMQPDRRMEYNVVWNIISRIKSLPLDSHKMSKLMVWVKLAGLTETVQTSYDVQAMLLDHNLPEGLLNRINTESFVIENRSNFLSCSQLFVKRQ